MNQAERIMNHAEPAVSVDTCLALAHGTATRHLSCGSADGRALLAQLPVRAYGPGIRAARWSQDGRVRAVRRHPRETLPGEVAEYFALAALPSAPFWARCHTRRVLLAWHLPTPIIETAELLASELVTNAAKFSGSAWVRPRYSELMQVERISYTLRYSSSRLTIEGGDSDPNPPILTDADASAENGRGLMLVKALSEEWSYYMTPPIGKVVYCIIRTLSESSART